MEEIVASSFTPSSRSFSVPVGDDGKHLGSQAQGALQQAQQASDADPAPAAMMHSQSADAENPLDDRDKETHAVDAFPWLPQAPQMGNVSPYLEFQRAVLARSGASLRMPPPATEAGPHSPQEGRCSAPGPVDVADSCDEAGEASSQVTPFEERMGACDTNGWYSNCFHRCNALQWPSTHLSMTFRRFPALETANFSRTCSVPVGYLHELEAVCFICSISAVCWAKHSQTF
jgi:hypothetical protein